jgi:aldehyde reductase
MSAPTKKLCNGMQIPVVGLGTYKEENEEKLVNAVKAAIKAGYRHFDCAHIYFNEQHIGKAIRESIQESNGALKREDFFIVSKLWNTFHSQEKVNASIDDILKRLGLDYLDLYVIHWPMGFKEDVGDYPVGPDGKLIPSDIHYTDTYRYMEDLVAKGKTKMIGVSNFNIQQLKDILGMCKIKPVCNQFEVNPLWQNIELVDFCKSQDVAVVAYAPLGAPDRGWSKAGDPVPLENPRILQLAKTYNKTPAQIILKWLLQRDLVVIPKSVTPSRIQENINLFDFTLTNEDMDVFKDFLKEQFRFYVFDQSNNHPFYPFKN